MWLFLDRFLKLEIRAVHGNGMWRAPSLFAAQNKKGKLKHPIRETQTIIFCAKILPTGRTAGGLIMSLRVATTDATPKLPYPSHHCLPR